MGRLFGYALGNRLLLTALSRLRSGVPLLLEPLCTAFAGAVIDQEAPFAPRRGRERTTFTGSAPGKRTKPLSGQQGGSIPHVLWAIPDWSCGERPHTRTLFKPVAEGLIDVPRA